MDDILRNIKRTEVQQKLAEINSYHPFLRFTIEEENDQLSLPFLDMLIRYTSLFDVEQQAHRYRSGDELPCIGTEKI